MTSTTRERGHVTRSHTADTIVEAWGPTREACLEEAARGFVASFADVEGAGWCRHVEVGLSGDDADLLLGLLEEIIYRLDAEDAVPMRVVVRPARDGVLADLWLTEVLRVEAVGAAPKGIARSDLACSADATGRWRCQVTVDV